MLSRTAFHGKRGELRQRYRQGQEDQLGALGLIVNVIVLWNTIYMDAALRQLRKEGFEVKDEDIRPPVAARLRAHQHARPLRLLTAGQDCTRGAAAAQEPQPGRRGGVGSLPSKMVPLLLKPQFSRLCGYPL